jgi:hypothetical protein
MALTSLINPHQIIRKLLQKEYLWSDDNKILRRVEFFSLIWNKELSWHMSKQMFLVCEYLLS